MKGGSVDAEALAAAQAWFARLLAPDCGTAERVAFDRWRTADRAHDAAYRQVEDVWHRSAGLRGDPAIAGALGEALRPAGPRRRRFEAWPSLAAAASVLLVAGLLLWNLWPDTAPATRHATVMGEQRTVVLEDGSRVVLDTDTALLARFGRRERELVLQRGQVDFTVQHEADRPFVVRTASGSVTAIGTRFQVRVVDGGSAVTLLEGRVAVAGRSGGPRRSATLAPGQRIVIDPDGRLAQPQTVSGEVLAGVRGWTQGNLVVKEWTLAAVVEEMNRYSATKLRLGDPALGGITVSGVFKAGDQKSFALAMEYGWSVRAEPRPADGEIVLSRK